MSILRPGLTVLATQASTGRTRQATLEGRNGCRPQEWLAHYHDERGKQHLMIVFPGTLVAVQTEDGFRPVLPGTE